MNRAEQYLKINGLLSDPFTLLWDFRLSTIFFVCCFNQVHHHFNDNDKGLKVYRQETKKSR